MKKSLKIVLAIVIFAIVAALCFYWDFHKYTVNEPMPDIEYKTEILKGAYNMFYTLEALRPIMGENELTEFIKANDKNPQIYTPSEENIEKGIYRANLHMHTTKSDGVATVEERLNAAQEYAQKHIKDGYMVVAITDHNTVWGAQEVVRVLEKNKGKYKNIKVVPGMEINTVFHNKTVPEPVQIHVLLWCINPYDEFLNKEFYKKDPKDKGNRKLPDRNFRWVIRTLSDYGVIGVAHPARYTSYMKDKKYPYITEMLTTYKKLTKKIPFTEGYYQSYKSTSTGKHLGDEYDKYINYINSEAEKLNITRTGSTDAHGESIFKYR